MNTAPSTEHPLLDVEHGWFIECYRCANHTFTDAATADAARAEFTGVGWRMESDGFQMCPRCANG